MVSIIIPIYNSSQYLMSCLKSIEKQDYKDFELLLINDASTDNSVEIINCFMDANPNLAIKLINMAKNSGQSAARNRGLNEAKGEFILFVDSDDTLSSNALSSLVQLAEKEHLEVTIGENYILKEPQTIYMPVAFKDDVVRNNNEILKLYLEGKWYNPAWNKLIRRDVIINNNLFFKEGFIFEDELWSFMLASKVHSLGVVRKPLYNYYVRPNSTMTTNKTVKRWNGLLKIMPFMKVYIESEGLINNAPISRFYLLKLVQIVNGLDSSKVLEYNLFNRIKELSYIDLVDLHKKGYLSIKETIAYYYFNMPIYIGYLYFRLINLYFKLFKR